MSARPKHKLKLQIPARPPQLSLAPVAEGADHPLTELVRLLARRAARQHYQQQIKERDNPGS